VGVGKRGEERRRVGVGVGVGEGCSRRGGLTDFAGLNGFIVGVFR